MIETIIKIFKIGLWSFFILSLIVAIFSLIAAEWNDIKRIYKKLIKMR